MTTPRHVFFISDRTGITAETLGNGLLTQFEGFDFRKTTLPFLNTADKARATAEYINHLAKTTGARPLVFSTTINDEVRAILRTANAQFLDLFETFIPSIEKELNAKSAHVSGRAHGLSDSARYLSRIDAMNFTLEHDDGHSTRKLEQAGIILVGPSRCGKTPTSLYLSLQHGIYAANFPLTEEELESLTLPPPIAAQMPKLYGLTSDPERLRQVRGERRPGTQYASLQQCSYEIRQAEQLYRKYNIPFINSASMSIEEIATVAMQEKGIRKQSF